MKTTLNVVGILLLVSACGSIAESDDDDGDGGTGPNKGDVNITVNDAVSAAPIAGAIVVFNKADGELISSTTTDASGMVTEEINRDTTVTVGYTRQEGGQNQHLILTVFAAQPLDALGYGPALPPPTGAAVGSANIILPTPAPTGATSYSVGLSCQDVGVAALGSPQAFAFFRDSCTRGVATIDLLGLAWNLESQDTPLYYSLVNDITTSGGSFNGASWVPGGQFNSIQVGANSSPIDADIKLAFRAFHDGLDYSYHEPQEFAMTAGQNKSFTFEYITGFAEMLQVKIELTNAAGDDIRMYLQNLAVTDNVYNMSLTNDLLPSVLGVAVDDADKSAPKLSWTVAEGHVGATANLGYIHWTSGTDEWIWQFIGPANMVTPVSLPTMPEAGPVAPWPIAGSADYWVAAYVEGSNYDTFSELRKHRGINLLFGADELLLDATQPAKTVAAVAAGGKFPQ